MCVSKYHAFTFPVRPPRWRCKTVSLKWETDWKVITILIWFKNVKTNHLQGAEGKLTPSKKVNYAFKCCCSAGKLHIAFLIAQSSMSKQLLSVVGCHEREGGSQGLRHQRPARGKDCFWNVSKSTVNASKSATTNSSLACLPENFSFERKDRRRRSNALDDNNMAALQQLVNQDSTWYPLGGQHFNGQAKEQRSLEMSRYSH